VAAVAAALTADCPPNGEPAGWQTVPAGGGPLWPLLRRRPEERERRRLEYAKRGGPLLSGIGLCCSSALP